MEDVKIIIGANFGDEGKGLATQFFAKNCEDSLVVRFNGGAQAGHTVMHNGERIVFSHFGSGTAVGVPTFLAEEFICNPIVFNREFDNLVQKGITPKVYVNHKAYLSTPFDMILNQEIERKRGSAKHGSCGIGIQETIRRSEQFGRLQAIDIWKTGLETKLKDIRDNWLPERMKFLGLETLPDFVYSQELIDKFLIDCKLFEKRISGFSMNHIVDDYNTVIFEGAQGLLLDQHTKYFPHATPTDTGLTNVVKFLKGFPPCPTEVVYMTRCYLTRHGAGPLETECPKPYPNIVDETNQPNEWQDTLRFGILDINLLRETVTKDFLQAFPYFTKSVMITCLDQSNYFLLNIAGDNIELNKRCFIGTIARFLEATKAYTCEDAAGETICLAKFDF